MGQISPTEVMFLVCLGPQGDVHSGAWVSEKQTAWFILYPAPFFSIQLPLATLQDAAHTFAWSLSLFSSPFFSDSLQSLLCTVIFFSTCSRVLLDYLQAKHASSGVQMTEIPAQRTGSAIFRRSPFLCMTWLPSLLSGNNHACSVMGLIGRSMWILSEIQETVTMQ